MKQAVVFIHGIGEQKPMDTLRAFVGEVLKETDGEEGQGERYWSKPDRISELFELRRLESTGRSKTHFYEYYWAYNVEGTRLSHLGQWLIDLLLRKPRDVPRSMRTIWGLSWLIAVLIAVTVILGGISEAAGWINSHAEFGAWWAVATAGLALVQYVLVQFVGDAARYLSPHPRNIALRQKIRAEGMQLLRRLHDCGEYDRIIIVGHSLGSVIGYDIITRLWQEYHGKLHLDTPATRERLASGQPIQPMVRDEIPRTGEALSAVSGDEALREFRSCQHKGFLEQRALQNPWLISDFVTLGSPLAHGMLLMAHTNEEFQARKRQRELPTCPPVLDKKGYSYSSPVTYKVGDKKFTPLVLHHAAPFAVTQWTNIFFPAPLGLFGDLIGGPLRPVFGSGVMDVAVTSQLWAGLAKYTPWVHTLYWEREPPGTEDATGDAGRPAALDALKKALSLTYLRKFNAARDPRGVGAVPLEGGANGASQKNPGAA
jgi:hypothetical protein